MQPVCHVFADLPERAFQPTHADIDELPGQPVDRRDDPARFVALLLLTVLGEAEDVGERVRDRSRLDWRDRADDLGIGDRPLLR
jgi:hypothetical protein